MTIFAYSTDEEVYQEIGEFDSHSAAFEEAANLLALQHGDSVWIGRKAEVDLNWLASDLAFQVIEHIAELAYDQYGEFADDWPDVKSDDMDELDNRLRDVVTEFLREHSPPKFWGIAEPKKFSI